MPIHWGTNYGMGQQQKQRDQDNKKPLPKVPDVEQVEIDSIEDLLQEMERIKKAEQDRCNCW